ncbi:MAG: competence protein ComEA [Candidatus Cloacimonetes bacterium HGW-Cloacimonetes-1]|jgi:DNA uptake protein ComE-like DNA-binding protein|nr:MAG: competence protein ComEA [Candidatus Cloacimonetes bacterium HGW-Cloacimonetes-1]
MRKYLILLFVLFAIGLFAERTDLNTASLQELTKLPITEQQAQDIYSYRQYIGFFDNIYELRKIASIDQKTLVRLRPLIVVSLYREIDEVEARRDEIRDLMERLDSNEGTSEGMADVWEDYLMTPQNLNRMSFDDLISLPNVSPVDAVAILKRVARGDTIADARDLRNTVGLSYYGYSNLRNYVFYKQPPLKDRLFVDGQIQYSSRYFEEGASDMFHEPMLRSDYQNTSITIPHQKDKAYWGYFNLDQLDPEITYKLRMRYGNFLKAGFMDYSAKGSVDISEKSIDDIAADSKYYVGYENAQLPVISNTGVKLYLGHYRATYGEGLTMENTDYYGARKTGYGFSKRILGISPDLSKTQEKALKGVALEVTNPYVTASVFFSQDKKDAIVYMQKETSLDDNGNVVTSNYMVPVQDSTGNYQVLGYVTPSVRFDNDDLREAEYHFNTELESGSNYATNYLNLAQRMNFLDEKIWGSHVQISPLIGLKLGFTTYTALYDNANFVVPDWDNLKTLIIRDSYYYPKFKLIDNDITGLYSTQTNTYKRDFRRVIGLDGHTVIGNTSVQGEYAELTVDGKDEKLGDDPSAYIVSAYTQYENLYFLTLYRNYDIKFDNPYSSTFSEHEKFDDTILEKNIYTLTNPTLSDMYQNSSQSAPEKGVYFETRYRFNSYFTVGRSYLDVWERLTDSRRSVRFQSELEFRPFFQLAIRARYKNQVNRYDDYAERGVSISNEYTLSTRTFLSGRDFLEFEYRYNTVWGPPYTSLTNTAIPGNNSMAGSQTLMIGDYLAVNYTHHFNKNINVQGSFNFWFGHGISHWDWEDMEIDFMGEKGVKAWVAVHSRISKNTYLTVKYRNKTYQDKEYSIRAYNVPIAGENHFERVMHSENTVRLSLDYRF